VARVVGIDPGTVSIDLCGLDGGQVFLDASIPTTEALADPETFLDRLRRERPVELIAGPSGYGLPLLHARDLSETDLRLAYLAPAGESGGIGGLRTLLRAMTRSELPIVMTPGVIHLPSVPEHRKVNRVDIGTADKVCAAALAVSDQMRRRACQPRETSLILLELGGAFSAALAIDGGRIVDGAGGSSGPVGLRAVGALDGEVAFLAGAVAKGFLFSGGAASVAGTPGITIDALATDGSRRGRTAWEAYIEGAVKAVAMMAVAVPHPFEVVLSGRASSHARVRETLAERLVALMAGVPLVALGGYAERASHAAQGAALVADGLAGGASADLVETLGIRDACGTALDHLFVITPAAARSRLGITGP
jgi:predicted butyrate kinase (DUF1464 family)